MRRRVIFWTGLVPATVHSGLKVKLAQMRVKTVKALKTSFKISEIDPYDRKKEKFWNLQFISEDEF